MQTVLTKDGHDARVVDEGDLLTMERDLRGWIVRMVWAVVTGAVLASIAYADVRSSVAANERRIEEIRVEGSVPVQILKQDIAVIKAELAANAQRQADMMALLERMERRR